MSDAAFESAEDFARRLDREDPLARFREQFHIPLTESGEACIYLCGNSLGLQPKKARGYIEQELDRWARLGVEGHFRGQHSWMPYHELLTEPTGRLVGALPHEVVVMNSLTVNLHLMMASFYRPTPDRFKILIEGGAFPSDQYAVTSQAEFHGYDPKEAVVGLRSRSGEDCLRAEDILSTIEREGRSIALILLGNPNYFTGQTFDIAAITQAGHAKGCRVGFDLAHGAGNLLLKLHEWGPDFAVWCCYKYLNAGPGAVAGCFVHEHHARDLNLPRFAGWWGHNKETRFEMKPGFDPIPGADGWQLSNAPILQMASLRASLELFDEAGMPELRKKAGRLTGYLEYLLDQLPGNRFRIITPRDPAQRGSQLSLQVPMGSGRRLLAGLERAGVICDYREPDVIRAAPVPLYNSFLDVWRFVNTLSETQAIE